MRAAAVRTLGVLLVVFAVGVLLRCIAPPVDLFAAGTCAAIAVTAYIAGRMLMDHPERVARRLTEYAALAVGAALAFGVRGLEPTTASLTPRQREAFEYLRTVENFEMPIVGFLAVRSRGYLAMRILHRSRDAGAAFQELVQFGTPAGQLYGLCGLYDTDPIAFSAALPRFRASNGTVGQFWGCVAEFRE